jgi:F-type H+-transporting ATPase subunit delta
LAGPIFVQPARNLPVCLKEQERISTVIKTAVARRYAQALFELLDPSNIEATRSTLHGLGKALSDSSSLRHVLGSPAFSVDEKVAVLTELGERFGCPAASKAFLSQLVKKNRVVFLPEIADAFSKLVDRSRGRQPIAVSSATLLSAAEQERITSRLREALKHDVDVTFHADAGHIAGLQIRIDSKVVDSTVRGRLSTMRTALTRE